MKYSIIWAAGTKKEPVQTTTVILSLITYHELAQKKASMCYWKKLIKTRIIIILYKIFYQISGKILF